MILTVDIGNTNIVIVLYSKNRNIVFSKRYETIKENDTEKYHIFFSSVYQDIGDSKVNDAIISCVVPSIQASVINAFEEVFQLSVILLNSSIVPNFSKALVNRNEIGSDLIATAIGAIYKYDLPCIIADLGSATKVTVVDCNQQFLGGLILPGLGMSSKAMKEHIPHLPEVDLKMPDHIMTSDTVQSIQAGLCYGMVSSIEGVSKRIEIELDIKATKVITGGYANVIASAATEFTHDKMLLNDGLYYAYHIIRESQKESMENS